MATENIQSLTMLPPAETTIQNWQTYAIIPNDQHIFYTLFDSHYYLQDWTPVH